MPCFGEGAFLLSPSLWDGMLPSMVPFCPWGAVLGLTRDSGLTGLDEMGFMRKEVFSLCEGVPRLLGREPGGLVAAFPSLLWKICWGMGPGGEGDVLLASFQPESGVDLDSQFSTYSRLPAGGAWGFSQACLEHWGSAQGCDRRRLSVASAVGRVL